MTTPKSDPRMALNDAGGTTAVEFALIAPILIALIIGALGLCLGLFLVGSLNYAVVTGARCAAVKTTICTDANAIIAYTQSRYLGPGSPIFTYTASSCGNRVTASINYALNLGLQTVTVPISATACFP